MAAAIVFCIVGPAAFYLSKYERKLLETEGKMSTITYKKDMIERDTKKIDELLAEIIQVLPKEQTQLNAKEQILLRLDDFQSNNKDVSIKIFDFVEQEGELSLPFSINFPVIDFTNTVSLISHLQGMKFPHCIIQSLFIASQNDGGSTCNINGAFVCFTGETVKAVTKKTS